MESNKDNPSKETKQSVKVEDLPVDEAQQDQVTGGARTGGGGGGAGKVSMSDLN